MHPTKTILTSIIFALLLASTLFSRDYETKSFTASVEETLAFRDTQEEVRQIAWLKAKLQVADMVEDFLIEEFSLDEVVPDEGARQRMALNCIQFYQTEEAWLETDPLTLKLTFTGEIIPELNEKVIERFAEMSEEEIADFKPPFVDIETLLHKMMEMREELVKADYDEVKSVREKRAELGDEFLAYEWYCKYRNYTFLDDRIDQAKQVECLTKAIEIQPAWALLYDKRAYALMNNRENPEYDRALVDISKALEIEPENEEFISSRAHIYNRMGIYDKALKDYSYLIEKYPDKANYYNMRATVYRGQGEYKDALKDIDRAIKLDPENVFYYTSKAYIYVYQGK